MVQRRFDLFVVLHRVVLLYGLNVKMMWWHFDFFIFGVWDATIVASHKLVHSLFVCVWWGGSLICLWFHMEAVLLYGFSVNATWWHAIFLVCLQLV